MAKRYVFEKQIIDFETGEIKSEEINEILIPQVTKRILEILTPKE